MLNRDDAVRLWRTYNQDESLFRHALSVEAALRKFAERNGEDPDFWGLVGLLHDIDYERWPKEHLKHAREILAGAGYPEEFIRAVESHGSGLCSDVEPLSTMEKTLYAVDELTGFITACAYVRPSRSVLDLEVKSVKKKSGSAAFAAGVDRSVIEKGAGMLGLPLEELIQETILALRSVADAVGLRGTPPAGRLSAGDRALGRTARRGRAARNIIRSRPEARIKAASGPFPILRGPMLERLTRKFRRRRTLHRRQGVHQRKKHRRGGRADKARPAGGGRQPQGRAPLRELHDRGSQGRKSFALGFPGPAIRQDRPGQDNRPAGRCSPGSPAARTRRAFPPSCS